MIDRSYGQDLPDSAKTWTPSLGLLLISATLDGELATFFNISPAVFLLGQESSTRSSFGIMWAGSGPDEIESATLTPAAPIQCPMGFTLLFFAYALPALLVGYRGYMSGKRFPWLKRGWVTLVVIALCVYLGWSLLDALLLNFFGPGKGLGVDAWTVMMFCCLLPAISGFCLWFGYMVAVIHRSYRDKDWSRLNDLWRRT